VTVAVLGERRRLARFILVGAGANISLFVLSYLFRSLGIAAFVAGAGAYAITFFAAYTAQRGWTFGSTESHAKVFPRYLAAQLACATLSGLVGHVSVEIFALSPFWMSVAVTAVAAVSSFLLSSLWVFAPSGERPRE
jgi:putative flippase GtrA